MRETRPTSPRRPRGRVCGLDPGRARVGVAIDDELGILAHPRGTLDPRDRAAFAAGVRALADAEDVTRFIVGLPLHLSGGEGQAARDARAMAQRVADATGRIVELWDERLSTVQAARSLAASEVRGRRARAHIDEAAACAILQSWLDARASRGKRR
ncbi:MAG: Holliday junction resolvase RuvX [Polyangiaceae bacterium]